ncbi:alpha-amylase family glycosyl hydrolase [Pseudoduganella sp. SL102]|uniref:alpha-amylase family glycosyl hydrolase n=1 Tax=Pseudoduganella sp. SL102 TaxID=2995154 RepID=UPI00248B4AC2|nr:alpha-amylase family glycosyl hydrolase [Pseudoduganella sp. SL102]WBS04015.1 alpha-amylase family glycosyl hydrolase [Pseudoduganella sp. SL102]
MSRSMTDLADVPSAEPLLAALPAPRRAAAARRYAEHGPLLYQRLAGLYGECPGFGQWYETLLATVGGLLAARPADLLALDARRAAEPDWFLRQDMLGYSAYASRFGGDLAGVGRRIGHLRALGVTYLHLLPFLRARAGENDGGFAVASFDDIDPALGSMADLETLCGQLRDAGISLCADFVLNHVADDHAWARGAMAGDARLRKFFHVFPDRAMPERYESTLGQVFPEAAPGNFTRVPAMEGWVWTTFYPFQWDLNYANPEVLAEIAAALLRLANRGVEVFRLDSTAFLWKREGTACMNQPEVHALLQALRAIVGIAAPAVLLKAEAIVPTRDLPAYLGDAGTPECHLAYHSTLMAAGWAALAEQETGLLRAVIARTPNPPPGASWLTYVRCHDDIGWKILLDEAGGAAGRLAAVARFFHGEGGTYAAGVPFQDGAAAPSAGTITATNGMAAALTGFETAEGPLAREMALRRLLLVHGVALAFGGMPMLYMGDELGTSNDHAYRTDAQRAHDTRWVQRPVFDDASLARRDDPDTWSGRVFHALRALVEERRQCPALAADVPRKLLPVPDDALLALARGDDFLALFNFSERTMVVDLPALGAGTWPGYSGKVELAPWSMLWLRR